jgi:signal peptidase I
LILSGPDLIGLLSAVLEKGSRFRFRAAGFSMAPFVRDGDIITVSPLRSRVPRLGDLVAFTSPGKDRLLVHRVVARKNDALLVKGDNLVCPDGLVPLNRLLGRVSRIERNGKRILLGLGPEKAVIALLARQNRLRSVLAAAHRSLRPILRSRTQ